MMKLFLSTLALITIIHGSRLLQQLPVDSGCDNPPAGFSCLDNQECCDIGDGVARCCNVTATTTTSAPTCGGIENCYQYDPDGCNTCTCDSNGLASCTEIDCTDTVDPNECLICNDGYTPNDTGECETCYFTQIVDPVCCEGVTYSNSGAAGCNQVSCPLGSEITDGPCTKDTTTTTPAPTCGGLTNCVQYTPDGCNKCSCGGACTKIGCNDTLDSNQCTLCEDGYIPNGEGECEVCGYFDIYDPVCCDGVTYSNSGEAECNQVSCQGEIVKGACTTTTPAPISACANVRCGADGKTECYENPVNGEATCCAPDDSCDATDYASTEVAICMDDGGLQKYDNKCFGRCDGNTNCGSLCRCDDSSQCIDGYECLETPFGFAGCDANVTDSCFGFCTKVGASCGGFVGIASCADNETCFASPIAPGQQPVGDCYSLPDQCLETTTTTTTETPAPSCGGIDYCRGYKPDPCNTCGCSDNGLERCTLVSCGDSDLFPNECTLCEDGKRPTKNGTVCETCFCTQQFDPVCCNGVTYGNACIAGCNQVSCNGTITKGECNTTTTTTTTTTDSPTIVACTRPRDCTRPDYQCRRDPICRVSSSIRCSDTDKVCVDYSPSERCDNDGDCDEYNGYWCLSGTAGGRGYCVKYEEP